MFGHDIASIGGMAVDEKNRKREAGEAFIADRDWQKLSDKSLSSCKHWTNIVPVRQKSRYNQLSLYRIRKIEIYLSSCKHGTEVSKSYYVTWLRAY